MKKLALVLFIALVFPSLSHADTTIRLQIETATTTLYDADIAVTPCPITPTSSTSTASIYCAIEQSGIDVTWSFFGEDAFIDSIGGVGNDFGANQFWLWWADLPAVSSSNPTLGGVAANAHELTEGENILIAIGKYPMRISVSSTSPMVGDDIEITVEEFGFDDSFNAVWNASDAATVHIGETTVTTSAGSATTTITSTDSFEVHSSKDGFVESSGVTVTPIAAPVPAPEPETESIRLRIAIVDSMLFDEDIEVEACEPSSGATTTVNGLCAIEQSGVGATWSFFGEDAFIDSIGGVANDFGANQFWLWWADLALGGVALNQHGLSEGEELLVAIGRFPLRLSFVATTTPNATSTLSVEEFGFDDAFNATWSASASSSISVGGQIQQSDAAGEVQFVATSTGVLSVFAAKSGFVDTVPQILTVADAVQEEEEDGSSSGASSGGGGGGTAVPTFNVPLAIQYLASVQKADGSFSSDFITDWIAIALASADSSDARDKARTYLLTAPSSLSTATDYERRAMALMALGVSPYDGTSKDYVAEIVSRFDGQQIGVPELVNDDVFALFVLLNAGYSTGDEIVQKTVDYILAKQLPSGSFEGSIDFTAATVQALAGVSALDGVPKALTDARSFLVNAQSADASFGNSFSTSWAIQGIAALGESASNWSKGGATPLTYLASLQRTDGAIELGTDSQQNREWVTAYAIPAAQQKTWRSLLSSFPKSATSLIASGGATSTTETASSTPMLATSTPQTATSTPRVATSTLQTPLETASSTPTVATSTFSFTGPNVIPDTSLPLPPEIRSGASDATDEKSSNQVASAADAGSSALSRIGALFRKFFSFFGRWF